MSLESKLLEWDKAGEFIAITASLLILVGARISEKVEIQRQNGVTYKPFIDPAQVIAIAVWLILIDRIWFTRTAKIRLETLQKSKRRGTYKGPLGPNYRISNGYLILTIGTILVALGLQEKADTAAQVVVL
jgi:hypothetical protein